MLIGVTGQIGAGKSEVAGLLKVRGAFLIDADGIGRHVTGSPAVLARLARAFGSEIRTPGGSLRAQALARIVFSDRSGRALRTLNQLVHPPLGKEIQRLVKRSFRSQPDRPVVIDAALLPDWTSAPDMELIILVSARRDLRIRRLVKRGMTAEDARLRILSQRPLANYRRIADVTIPNNEGLAELRARVIRLWEARIEPGLQRIS
ncbi:MAG: dephospho-CoA kinase [Candidatus Zixiibacteriota bacterium]